MIVISKEKAVKNETAIMRHLLQYDILLHIRRPMISSSAFESLIQAIGIEQLDKLVSHQQHDLAAEMGFTRLHFNSQDRKKGLHVKYQGTLICSTSTHSIAEFNSLDDSWDYAFLSPFYPSISKQGYGEGSAILKELPRRTNQNCKLIALGGIHKDNLQDALDAGADDVAMLGSIWQAENPVSSLASCLSKIEL